MADWLADIHDISSSTYGQCEAQPTDAAERPGANLKDSKHD